MAWRWRNLISREERGTISVLFALGLVAFLGFTALALDAGRAYVASERLRDVADAAALAAARELPGTQRAAAVAVSYAAYNGVAPDQVTVEFPDADSVRVRLSNEIQYLFAPVLGFQNQALQVATKAVKGGAASISGAVPFAVYYEAEFQFGQKVCFKVGGAQGGGGCAFERDRGNFGALALGGTGANLYRDNLKYGYGSTLRIGDRVNTETGDITGPTQQGTEYRIGQDPNTDYLTVAPGSPRVVYAIVFNQPPVSRGGGSYEVTISGFAAFFLESYQHPGKVVGRFLKWIAPGDVGGPNYGLEAILLKE